MKRIDKMLYQCDPSNKGWMLLTFIDILPNGNYALKAEFMDSVSKKFRPENTYKEEFKTMPELMKRQSELQAKYKPIDTVTIYDDIP